MLLIHISMTLIPFWMFVSASWRYSQSTGWTAKARGHVLAGLLCRLQHCYFTDLYEGRLIQIKISMQLIYLPSISICSELLAGCGVPYQRHSQSLWNISIHPSDLLTEVLARFHIFLLKSLWRTVTPLSSSTLMGSAEIWSGPGALLLFNLWVVLSNSTFVIEGLVRSSYVF